VTVFDVSVVDAGDEHWTKVLQANDALGKLPVCPYHGKKLPLRCAFNDDVKTTSVDQDQVPEPGDRVCRRRRTSRAGAEDHPPGDAPVSTETKERTGLTMLFDRFCQWWSETRRQSSLLRLPLPKSRSRRASSLRRSPGDDTSSSRGRWPSRRRSRRRCNSASPSSSHGDLNDPTIHRSGSGSRATSTCSSATTATSTSTACSDVISRNGSVGLPDRDDADVRFPLQRCHVTSARSGNDVGMADVLQQSVSRCECSPLISTWPGANGELSTYIHTYMEQSIIAYNCINLIAIRQN